MNELAIHYERIVDALSAHGKDWVFIQYLTENGDRCIYVGKLNMISSGEVKWSIGDPSLFERIFCRHRLKGSFGYEVDLWFEDGIRSDLIGFGGLSENRLARVMNKSGGVIYQDINAIVEWNIGSGIVSVLCPSDEIVKALNPYRGQQIFCQYLTEDNDPAVFISKLDSIVSREVSGAEKSVCLSNLFPWDYFILEKGLLHETDLHFDNRIRSRELIYLPNNRLARVIKQGGEVIYNDERAMVEWNIRSGMVSILYPAEDILRNFGFR